MAHAHSPFVGRATELDRLHAAAAEAIAGRGGAWLVTGEPGIGKSRLLDELAARATEDGMVVAWGRCWEVGGAPPHWPWIQILRALLRRVDVSPRTLGASRAAQLAQLVPELADVHPSLPSLPALEPEQARFSLLDAYVGLVCDLAETHPVALFVDDLHAADPSSVLLLEMLAPAARAARVLVVASFRQAEAQRSSVAPLVARVARDAHGVALGRLGREDVAAYLRSATGSAPPDPAIDALHGTSEGNPLFLVESARWLMAHRDLGAVGGEGLGVIPRSIGDVIEQRLADLGPDARRVVALASILGRDFASADLGVLCGCDPSTLEDALGDASAAAILIPVAPGVHRFAHILIREALYAELDPDARRALHRTLADALGARAPTPWSELTHHLFAAGRTDRAVEAAACAADVALDRLAFDDAVTWLERALDALGPTPVERRCELLLTLARARIDAGDPAGGRESCREAAQLARTIDDSSLLARAALEYGRVFVFGEVDPVLVELLEETLRRLPPSHAALRARAMARLAAAMQPAADPDEPIALAREAISVARGLDDPAALLATLRAAVSAMMDLGDPAERVPLHVEHVALARRLDEPVEGLRGSSRLVLDRFELGDPVAAAAAIDDAEGFAERLELPYYRWRIAAFRSMLTARRGDFEAARAHHAEAEALAARSRDPNAPSTIGLQRALFHRARGDDEALLVDIHALRAGSAGHTYVMQWLLPVMESAALARLGRVEAARAILEPDLCKLVLQTRDASLVDMLADVAVAAGDVALARQVLACLEPRRGRCASWGMIGMDPGPPIERALGLVLGLLGRHDEADACFERARARMLAQGALPWAMACAVDHASQLSVRDPDRAAALIDEIEADTAPALAPWRARAAALRRPSERDGGTVTLLRDGELWTLRRGPTTLRLKDTKGVRLLACLLDAPGRAQHVLDLESPTGRRQDVDAADAGEAIDEQAKQAYRRRVESLRAQIDEAEAWNDAGRAERARAELEALMAELARSVGLGGRLRRERGAAERARVNVQRRIKDALKRIRARDEALGAFLEEAVQTGTECCYRPAAQGGPR